MRDEQVRERLEQAKKAEEDAAMARTEKSVWGSIESAKINAARKLEVDRQQEMIQEAELLYRELLEAAGGDPSKIPPEKRAQYENLMIVATKLDKYVQVVQTLVQLKDRLKKDSFNYRWWKRPI
jgi:FMN phosphatase YigB (HAD superfamily)